MAAPCKALWTGVVLTSPEKQTKTGIETGDNPQTFTASPRILLLQSPNPRRNGPWPNVAMG